MTTETTSKATPGPWVAGPKPAWDAIAEIDMWPIYYGEPDEDGGQRCVAFAFTQSDARLIAAAPKLLDALQALMDDIEGSSLFHIYHDYEPWGKARAAIAKATGAAS